MNYKILQVDSLNLKYKNDFIKSSILENYSNLLNGLQIPIEIIYNNNNIYIYIKHNNKNILKTNVDIIKLYLKNMELSYKEININNEYKLNYIGFNYVNINNKYYKTIYIDKYPYSVNDGFLDFLYNINMDIYITQFIYPQNTYKSIKLLRKRLSQYTSSEILEEENNYDSKIYSINYMLNELNENTSKFFTMSLYIIIKSNNIDDLNYKYNKLKNILNSKSIISYSLLLNQYKTLNILNHEDLNKQYGLTTSSLKSFIPFLSYTINDYKGINIGINLENKTNIYLDLFKRQYLIMLILGVMGSGKSFLLKNIITQSNDIEFTIIDKLNEYKNITNNNIIKYSNKTYKEYINILNNYSNQIDEDYNNNKLKPRILVIDEICDYLFSEYGNQFSEIINKLILQGRKKYLGFICTSQNIEMLLKDINVGNNIIKTSNINFLMRMKMNEAIEVSKQFFLNKSQINFLSSAEYSGLMMLNSNCVKFKTKVNKQKYDLFNTNPIELTKLNN